MNGHVLIITSCVRPFASHVDLKDVGLRESLHQDALTRWIIESAFTHIVVCDNSAYMYPAELAGKADEIGKKLEILSFQANKDAALKYGKGYGEGELIAYVFEHSRLLSDADSFFKVTGKLYIDNQAVYVERLLRQSYSGVDFVFNHPAVPFYQHPALVYTDFYFARKQSFQEFLLHSYLQVRDAEGIYLEHVYYQELRKHLGSGKQIKVETMYPVPVKSGRMGSTNNVYGKGRYWYVMKNLLLKSPLVGHLYQ